VTSEEQFKRLVESMTTQSAATYGNDASQGARRMFGSTSIKTGGKMFAFLHKRERLVVKLPEARVDELLASGAGLQYDPGDGRKMREWMVVASDSYDDWLALAREAEAFAGKGDMR
jgi:TfoX/Sxy family transcriptional regulator of competence genes